MPQNVAQVIAQIIRENDIDTVYGLPGGENADLMEAIRLAGIDFILVRNESSAVYMADVYARLSGRPGVCLTTLGPGATNAYAGVAHAWLDRAPVLILTAQSIGRLLGRHTHQVLDLQAVFRPITKLSAQIEVGNVAQLVRQALRLTMEGRPGPVHLGLSSETAKESVLEQTLERETKQTPPQVKTEDARYETGDLARAQALLSKARRPVLLCGLGLEPERCYATILELAEAARAPVVVTPKAKGAIADDHPLAAGVIGLTRVDPAYQILDDADCIVAIGYDVVELVKPWDQPQALIWIAPWANADPVIQAEVELTGPMTPVLQQLIDLDFQTEKSWGQERVQSYHRSVERTSLPEPDAGQMRPQSVVRAIRQAVARDTLFCTDVGSHKILAGLTWPTLANNRYMVSNGLSAMGFGLPAAAAASRILQEPTVCLIGDGGMGMVIGELNMIIQEALPVIVVVMNDNALDLIRSAQKRMQAPAFGTEFPNPDFVAIAQAYGISGHRVTTVDECVEAVSKAWQARLPALIEAIIDPASYPSTPGFVWGQ